jgi:hypothetical protein
MFDNTFLLGSDSTGLTFAPRFGFLARLLLRHDDLLCEKGAMGLYSPPPKQSQGILGEYSPQTPVRIMAGQPPGTR